MEAVGHRVGGFAPDLKNRGLRSGIRRWRVLDFWTFECARGAPHKAVQKSRAKNAPFARLRLENARRWRRLAHFWRSTFGFGAKRQSIQKSRELTRSRDTRRAERWPAARGWLSCQRADGEGGSLALPERILASQVANFCSQVCGLLGGIRPLILGGYTLAGVRLTPVGAFRFTREFCCDDRRRFNCRDGRQAGV
jgi:hypothetical protein